MTERTLAGWTTSHSLIAAIFPVAWRMWRLRWRNPVVATWLPTLSVRPNGTFLRCSCTAQTWYNSSSTTTYTKCTSVISTEYIGISDSRSKCKGTLCKRNLLILQYVYDVNWGALILCMFRAVTWLYNVSSNKCAIVRRKKIYTIAQQAFHMFRPSSLSEYLPDDGRKMKDCCVSVYILNRNIVQLLEQMYKILGDFQRLY